MIPAQVSAPPPNTQKQRASRPRSGEPGGGAAPGGGPTRDPTRPSLATTRRPRRRPGGSPRPERKPWAGAPGPPPVPPDPGAGPAPPQPARRVPGSAEDARGGLGEAPPTSNAIGRRSARDAGRLLLGGGELGACAPAAAGDPTAGEPARRGGGVPPAAAPPAAPRPPLHPDSSGRKRPQRLPSSFLSPRKHGRGALGSPFPRMRSRAGREAGVRGSPRP